jgi:hypothetical protein
MIIIDAVDAPRKTDNAFTGPTIRHPDQVTLRSVTASLPDYESSQKEHGGLVEEGRKRKKGRFGSTFWRGAIVAFIVYVVLGLAVGVPIAVTVSFHGAAAVEPMVLTPCSEAQAGKQV